MLNFHKKKEVDKNTENEPKFVKLATVFGMFKVSLIQGALEDNDIPYISNSNYNDSFIEIFTGGSMLGTDFYVPDYLLEKSEDILKNLFGDSYDLKNLSI